MSKYSYRSIDDIQRFLAQVWSSYPSVYGNYNQRDEILTAEVLSPLINRSYEFCSAIKEGKAGMSSKNSISPFFIEEDGQKKKLKLHVISASSFKNYKTYFVEISTKKIIPPQILSLEINQERGNYYYISNSYLHETIVGSLISHLVDLGLLLNSTRYFGTFACDIPTILLEKSNFQLYNLMGVDESLNKVFNSLSSNDIIGWMTGLAHAFYTYKYYFGISHFDVNLQNIMLTYVKQGFDISKDRITSSMYGGKYLRDIEYIMYEMPFNTKNGKRCYIAVKNNGLIPKLTNFELSTANLPESIEHNDSPLIFLNSPEIYNQNKILTSNPNQGDIEYNYLGYNILRHLEKLSTPNYQTKIRQKSIELLEDLYPFFEYTIGNYNNEYVSVENRNVGTSEIITYPLIKLFNYLPKISNSSHIAYVNGGPEELNIKEKKVLTIPLATSKYNPVSRFFKTSKPYYNMCLLKDLSPEEFVLEANKLGIQVPEPITNDVKKNVCKEARIKYLENSPTSVARQNMFTHQVDNTSSLMSDGKLKDNITEEDLSQYLRVNLFPVNLYTLNFNPKSSGMEILYQNQRLDYKYSQRKRPPLNKLGKLMKDVNIHLLYYQGRGKLSFNQNGTSLFESAVENLSPLRQGVSIECGIYVKKNKKHLPVGFFYNRFLPFLTSTAIPVPTAYRKRWGVIIGDSLGNLKLEKYSTFLEMHSTQISKVVYQLTDDEGNNTKLYHSRTKTILSENNRIFYKDGREVEYDFACTSGPILIWDSTPIFTQSLMERAKFEIELLEELPDNKKTPKQLQPYKLVGDAENNSLYFSEVGETSKTAPYKQRDSNDLKSHSVICQDKNGKIFFVFVEGNISATGLDRVQLTELLMKFNVDKAVSLNSGFTSNAVFKENAEVHKYLLKNPKNSKVSMTINIGIL